MTFDELQSNALAEWGPLEKSEIPRVYIGTDTCGCSCGALEVLDRLRSEIEKRKIALQVVEVACVGWCACEPLVAIAKGDRPLIYYDQVTPDIASQLVTDYITNDNPRTDLALCQRGKGEIDGIPDFSELPWFRTQVRIALRNCGSIDPGNMNHYIACGDGYRGLFRALQMSPSQVIEEVNEAGLRGRGGAGFLTGKKWRFCREAAGDEKYIICNAAEGDPKGIKDRALLEGDPHAVLEGMLIGAYAIGATQGFVYVSGAYDLAAARLKTALKQMTEAGILGDHVLGSDFGFTIGVVKGGVGLVCGEETAAINSIGGKEAIPIPRPPYPSTIGLHGKPTEISNVETFAHVSAVMQKGAEWYAGYGTEDSKGTKVFTLSGNVVRPGLIEVPMGTTLRHIIYDIGGGIRDDKEFKAVQVGGPSGGWLSDRDLDMSIDFKTVTEAGSIIGSGTIVVANSDTCAVDLARTALAYIHTESCGRCIYGREGSRQMVEILTDIAVGRGRPTDIDLLIKLGEGMRVGSLCGLGKSAPNPVLTTIERFRSEYETHIKAKQCPAKVCEEIEPAAAAE